MRRLKIFTLVTGILLLSTGLVLFAIGYFKPKSAAIFVETVPASSVFIDGEQVGRTPYEATLDAKEVVIKLIPESFDKPLVPFETKVSLAPGIKTIVTRNFGETNESASGEILSFEKIAKKEMSLVVVTLPDSTQISLDGQIMGFAPYKTSSITAGEHQLIVSTPGFEEKILQIKTIEGFKLTAVVQLKADPETIELEEEVEETVEEMVKILSTPTGFLRVRSEPSVLGKEIGRVEPGETHLLIEKDSETGWFKISIGEDEEGWVSGRYVEEVDPPADGEEEEEE